MDILVAVLKHPLTLLLAGAVLTNYLIPRITRRWQDRQKEIELKTAFVSEVSDAALEMLISVQYAELGAKSQTQDDYDEAYRRWETERARIGARMRGFFPDTGLQEKWQALADAITSVYALSGTHDTKYRQMRIDELKPQFPNAVVDWDTLAAMAMKTGSGSDSMRGKVETIKSYRQAWFGLREAILGELGALVEAVLDARVAWLQPRPRGSFLRDSHRKTGAVKEATPPPDPVVAVPIASETQVHYDIFGAIAPPDIDEVDESDPQSLADYSKKWFNYGNPEKALDPITRVVTLSPKDAALLHHRKGKGSDLLN